MSRHISPTGKRNSQGLPPFLQLPTDRPRPLQQAYRGARFTFHIDPTLLTALRRFSQQEGVTLFMTLIAAFQVLLARYTGENDIVVGSPIAGRMRPESEALIGVFINTIVIRTDVSDNPTFRALLHRVQDTAFDAYAHQELPFEQLVEELHVPRTLGYAPLVQVLFALQNVPRSPLQFPGITTTTVALQSGAAKVDLSVMMWDDTHELRGQVEYSTDLFEATTIARLADHYQVLLELTASLFNLIIDDAPEVLSGLRQLLIGGEVLSVPHVRRALAQLPGTQIINGYGPTENTTFTCCYRIPPTLPADIPSVPIGRPIANTHVYILDQNLQLLPTGVAGELYVGGDGLAHGYLNQPQLTAERFISHPFSDQPGVRLYKTGDVARYLPDGNIEFLGRRDHQVKVRGFRIELGESETILGQHPAVQHAVVVLREERPADTRLVAYVVPRTGKTVAAHDVQMFLRQRVPEYMLPAAFVFLESLPLSTTGKLDRRALPVPPSTPGETAPFITPQGTLEIQLAKIWEHVLARSPIGVTENFFDLGGNSLLVIRTIAHIRKTVGKNLSVAAFFQNPTIEQQAHLFRQQQWKTPASLFVPLQQYGSRRPFFCISGWVALARYVAPDQPFYMARAHGYDGTPAPTTIEEMAQRYIKEIRALQPEGPYFLGGHSYGGLVAFEIAQQLHRQEHTVAFLALLDPSSARQNQAQRTESNIHVGWRYRLSWLLPFSLQHHWTQLKQRNRQQQIVYLWHQFQDKIMSKLQFLLSHVYLQLGCSIPLGLRPAYTNNLHMRAVKAYRAQRYPGRAVLFHTERWHPEYQHQWQQVCDQGLDIHYVTGSHLGMFEDGHLRAWAPQFAKLLQQAQNNYAPDATTATAQSSTSATPTEQAVSA